MFHGETGATKKATMITAETSMATRAMAAITKESLRNGFTGATGTATG